MPWKIDASDMNSKMTFREEIVYIRTEIAGVDIAHEWESHTRPYVPLKEGYLEGGFTYEVTTPPPILGMEAKYDAESNKGYKYPLIQEDISYQKKAFGVIFKHPLRGTSPYFEKGRKEVDIVVVYAMNLRSVL